jgi:hypothetical protein
MLLQVGVLSDISAILDDCLAASPESTVVEDAERCPQRFEEGNRSRCPKPL